MARGSKKGKGGENLRTSAELVMERTDPTSADPASFPTGFQLPANTKVERATPPLPPDVTAEIEKARKCGKFFIAIVRETSDDGDLEVFTSRVGMNSDFLLRGWQEVCSKIIDGTLAGKPIVPGEKGG